MVEPVAPDNSGQRSALTSVSELNRSTMLNKFLRAALAIYLLHSTWESAPGADAPGFEIPFWHKAVLATIALVCLISAALVAFSPRLGRWPTLVCQAPQIVGIITPPACFSVMVGFHLVLSLGYFPEAGGFTPFMDLREGADWCMALGRTDGPSGFAVIANFSALAAIWCAFFISKRSNQPPQTTPVSAPR